MMMKNVKNGVVNILLNIIHLKNVKMFMIVLNIELLVKLENLQIQKNQKNLK
jgi:hypothetical protein